METKDNSGEIEEMKEDSEKAENCFRETKKVHGEVNCCFKERKSARVVISSVTLETNAAVSSYIDASPYVKNSEVCQLAVTKSKKVGGSTLMMAQNPVTVFSFDVASEG